MRRTAAALLALLPLAAFADPFPKGDPRIGEKLVQEKCVACHVRLAGGDGSAIYTRAERKVNSPTSLRQRVAVCNAQLGSGWFPEDEEHAAAYLNQRYYKFK